VGSSRKESIEKEMTLSIATLGSQFNSHVYTIISFHPDIAYFLSFSKDVMLRIWFESSSRCILLRRGI
jgi:hypothetical protein